MKHNGCYIYRSQAKETSSDEGGVMGTNALIGLETNSGIAFRYVNYDGYPEGVGLELLAYKEQAEQIVMSAAEQATDWDEVFSSETSPDRILDIPETRSPVRFSDRQAFLEFASGRVSFVYLWDGQQWWMADMVDDAILRVLSSSDLA